MACGLKRILQLKEAIRYQKIRVYSDENDITTNCTYSWSTDGICWSNWTNIDTYDLICKNIETDFYLRVLILGNFSRISVGDVFTNCYSICLDTSNAFLTDFCGTNLFQPYQNLDCALLLQQQLADSIVCMFGIPVFYFRVEPNKETADYTFKEYFLHHIEDVKQIKLMIPDGQMPSSNPKLTEFDFDWETDWETELSKTQFANAFGDNAFPKSGDFLYIPLMKRMWEVNSAYDEKNEGLMWRSTTWKLALVKYTEATNVEPSIYDDIIDGWIQHYEDVFGDIEKNEQERTVGANAIDTPSFSATNLYDIFMEDSIRKQYTKQDTTILDKTYNQRGTIIARNIYKFKNENGCIVYQKPICGDSGTISFIIETSGNLQGEVERDVLNFGNVQLKVTYDKSKNKFNIIFGDLHQELEPFKSYMVMIKWDRGLFNTELNVYEYTHRNDVPIYKLKPEMYWFDFENPICEKVGIYNNDYDIREPMECQIHMYPLMVTNIKYYNSYLDKETSIKESVKYVTQQENCIINDLARHISSGYGYAVK